MSKSTTIPNYIWQALGLPIPESEFKFHPTRKWRIDYCYPDKRIAIELEGGCWTNGRHNRGTGFINDMEKYNMLSEYGWSLFRYQPNKIDFEQIKRVYCGK